MTPQFIYPAWTLSNVRQIFHSLFTWGSNRQLKHNRTKAELPILPHKPVLLLFLISVNGNSILPVTKTNNLGVTLEYSLRHPNPIYQ